MHGPSHLPVRESADEDVSQLVLAVAGTLGWAPFYAAVFSRRDRVDAGVAVVRVDERRPGAREEGDEGLTVLLADLEEVGAADGERLRGTVWYQGLKLGSAVVVFTCLEV